MSLFLRVISVVTVSEWTWSGVLYDSKFTHQDSNSCCVDCCDSSRWRDWRRSSELVWDAVGSFPIQASRRRHRSNPLLHHHNHMATQLDFTAFHSLASNTIITWRPNWFCSRRRKMKGLTSKEHLFLRVLALVTLINADAFYNVSRYMQTFVANFFEVVAFITALTVLALAVVLEFWWRYFRRMDNQRFWKPQNSN